VRIPASKSRLAGNGQDEPPGRSEISGTSAVNLTGSPVPSPVDERSDTPGIPSSGSVRAQLQKILGSDSFSAAPALSSLLSHIVETTLDSKADQLKEYTLGVEALGRGESFDPRTDTIVRVQIRRLRAKLMAYYQGEGRVDPIVIELPTGHYVPTFRLSSVSDEVDPGDAESSPRLTAFSYSRAAWAGAAAFLAALLGYALLVALRPEPLSMPGRPGIRSVAVLPLENLSGDPAHDFFADAMTDELIMSIGKTPDLRVISRTSSVLYRDSGKSLPEIGRELGVDAVVEGSVQRSHDRVKIHVRLVHAATERALWSETFQSRVRDLLVLQDDLGRRITSELSASITPPDRQSASRARAIDPAALDVYLKGWQLAYAGRAAFNAEEQRALYASSIENFERAIEIDPGFALAWASMSQVAYWLSLNPGGLDWQHRPDKHLQKIALVGTNYRKAREAANRALAMDENLAVAQTALANVLYRFEFDWEGAEEAFRKAIVLNPNYAEARHGYAVYLSVLGRHDEAIREIRLARELDPLTSSIHVNLGQVYLNARQYDRALEELQQIVDLPGPAPPRAHLFRAWAYMYEGMPEEAVVEWLAFGTAVEGDEPLEKKVSVWIHAASGRIDEAKAVLDELLELTDYDGAGDPDIPFLFAVLGETDQSLSWFEGWLERDYPPEYFRRNVVGIYTSSAYDHLRSEPRFHSILDRLGFPPRTPSQF
jgi:TolB-like protein/tetratricopeptide (TPR) repeat protein